VLQAGVDSQRVTPQYSPQIRILPSAETAIMSNAEVLQEELEVLESIFPDELERELTILNLDRVLIAILLASIVQRYQSRNCGYESNQSKRFQGMNVRCSRSISFAKEAKDRSF
jgi:hypothetical protein